MDKLNGLSLSFCVCDILSGKIPESAVSAIYCGFQWTGKAPDIYFECYWNKWPKEDVIALLNRLTILNRPGCNSWEVSNIARGRWMFGDVTLNRLKNVDDRLRTEEAVLLLPTILSEHESDENLVENGDDRDRREAFAISHHSDTIVRDPSSF